MEVGTAPQDCSPFLVRDMSGNGKEWTRTPNYSSTSMSTVDFTKLPTDAGERDLRLRGHDYKDDTPLTFKDLLDERRVEYPGAELLDAGPQNYIGFRVVIEP